MPPRPQLGRHAPWPLPPVDHPAPRPRRPPLPPQPPVLAAPCSGPAPASLAGADWGCWGQVGHDGQVPQPSPTVTPPDGVTGATSGPHPTRQQRTTPGNDGHLTSQLDSPSRPASQVVRPPRFSLARTKSPVARSDTIRIEQRTIQNDNRGHRQQWYRSRQARPAVSRPRMARTGFPAGPGSPGWGSVGGHPRCGSRAACPPAPSG